MTMIAGFLNVRQRTMYLQVRRAEAKQILFDQESRYGLQVGINKVADAVGVTLGPRGAPNSAARSCHQ